MKNSLSQRIQIGERVVADGEPVYVIAEAGVNHDGDMGRARALVDAAVAARADAVKFQIFSTDDLVCPDAPKAPYQMRELPDDGPSQAEMLRRLELSPEQHWELLQYCQERAITYLTTPFDRPSLDALDRFDLPAYKISSTDADNLPFLRTVAAKGKPLILSTGMSYLTEVERVLTEICAINTSILVLQCVADYPAADHEANLAVITTYRRHFGGLVGYSDHTAGLGAGPYAVVLGARVIEKHLTLDRESAGPDHSASLDPEEFTRYVRAIRTAERFLGSGRKMPTFGELGPRATLRKSLVAARPIIQGAVISAEDLTAKRAGGGGMSPLFFDLVVGSIASRSYQPDEVILECPSR